LIFNPVVPSVTQNASIACVKPTITPEKKREKKQKAHGNPIVPMPKQVIPKVEKEKQEASRAPIQIQIPSKLHALNA
jgi:hypothetical protein